MQRDRLAVDPAVMARATAVLTDPPTVDVVVPAHNEAPILERTVRRLHRHCQDCMPYDWQITIADNASDDGTGLIARTLAAELPAVRIVRLEEKGRGRALKAAWSTSEADIVAYTDADLSTGLDALVPLVAALATGHAEVAIGSRLVAGSAVVRGPRREVISRSYNALLRLVFAPRFSDAQCGFKAVRADVAGQLVPRIVDDGWFFDTELLLLADRNDLRIHEVAVDWTDDPDSSVVLLPTIVGDLRGVARIALLFLAGGGSDDAVRSLRPAIEGTHSSIGALDAAGAALATTAAVVAYDVSRRRIGAAPAGVVALIAAGTTARWTRARAASRRTTPQARHRTLRRRTTVGVAGLLATSTVAVFAVRRPLSRRAELAALVPVWSLTAFASAMSGRDGRRPGTSVPVDWDPT